MYAALYYVCACVCTCAQPAVLGCLTLLAPFVCCLISIFTFPVMFMSTSFVSSSGPPLSTQSSDQDPRFGEEILKNVCEDGVAAVCGCTRMYDVCMLCGDSKHVQCSCGTVLTVSSSIFLP